MINYRTYPIVLGLAYTMISVVFSILNIIDFRIYIILFAIVSVIIELIYYPLPKDMNYIASSITAFWIILSVYFVLQIFGII
jgi:hypothetical protein